MKSKDIASIMHIRRDLKLSSELCLRCACYYKMKVVVLDLKLARSFAIVDFDPCDD